MPCYHPKDAWRGWERPDGIRPVVFRPQDKMPDDAYIQVPCYKCVGCVLERARVWSMRCMDEASLYRENCFITLTFNDKFLPLNRGLDKSVFQKFMKRLRKALGSDRPVRYFHCGEYGPLHGRPHYHALLFGVSFPDRVYFKTTDAGEKIFTSEFLSSVWSLNGHSLGHSSVGDLSHKSCAYVARYSLKKVNSFVEGVQYLDRSTGEVLPREYVTMSRRPGIGRKWIETFLSDVYPRGVRVIKGLDTPTNRFYDSVYETVDPVGFDALKQFRNDRRVAVAHDNTPRRLLDKEAVKLSQIKLLMTAKEV